MGNKATSPQTVPQPASSRSRVQQALQMMADFSVGLLLGALMGLILGMSVSPVAGTVLGGLVALLASFFGLRSTSAKDDETGKEAAPTPHSHLAASRMAGFGLGSIMALLCGLYLRTHGGLSPSPQVVAARWTEAHFPPEQARMLAAYELIGTFPPEFQKTVTPPPSARGTGEDASNADKGSGEKKQDEKEGWKKDRTENASQGRVISARGLPTMSVLFSNDLNVCNELSKEFKDGPAAMKFWSSFQGGWAGIAAQVKKTRKPEDQLQALETIRTQLCPD